MAEGTVAGGGLAIADGQRAGVGDEIVTRQNNRLLTAARSWVKNGDRFVVTATNADGSMAVRRGSGGAEVVLPADYVAQHVELATPRPPTGARVGRSTRRTSMVSPTTTREVLYVAATRGRESNMVYVDTTFDPDPATGHDGTIAPAERERGARWRARQRGCGASLRTRPSRGHSGQAEDFATLAAEYETLGPRGSTAALGRAAGSLGSRTSPPRAGSREPRLRSTARHPPRRRGRGLDVERTFPVLVEARSLDDAEDPAAVIRGRVDRWAQAAGSTRRAGTDLIAGLIPRAAGVTDPDMARASRSGTRRCSVGRGHWPSEAIEREPGLGTPARLPAF